MKILHILGDRRLPQNPDISASSGIVNAVLETAKAQVKLGHTVWIASVQAQAWQREWQCVRLIALEPARWAHVRIGGKFLDLSMHLPFASFTRRHRFDLVIGNGYLYMRLIHASVRMVNFHSSPTYKGRNSEKDHSLRSQDYHRLATDTDAQLCVSHYIARELGKGLGHRGNVRVAYNGVDLERFDSSLMDNQRWLYRHVWGVDEKDIVFLFAGAIIEEKGVILLARVFASISKDHPDFHLVIAGGSLWNDAQDEYEIIVKGILEDACNRDRVHFLGKVERMEMPSIYSAIDIVTVPSCVQEAFPLVALESLAAGKPLIASKVGGLPEAVTPDVGFLVPPGEESILQSTMLMLGGDGELRSKMARAARKRALDFSWSKTAITIDSTYQEAMNRKQKR